MKQHPIGHPLQGFDTEFKDLEDYIRVITARIWEGRQIDAIRTYYSDPCAVITPSGATTDVESVINSTKATLAQFPDRRLLAEDVIEAGNAQTGFLSSHRIMSTMTHLGDGHFGKASGQNIHVRTIADCVCKDNRIVHEWLVRDQGAIALAVGSTPREMAAQWLQATGGEHAWHLPQPPAPTWWHSPISGEPLAQRYARGINQLLSSNSVDETLYDEAACSLGPCNHIAYGRSEIRDFWLICADSIHVSSFQIESLAYQAANATQGRPPRAALRWRMHGASTGAGRYAGVAGKPLDILGICHVEFVCIHGHWCIHREWVLIDDVAVWMQLLTAPSKFDKLL